MNNIPTDVKYTKTHEWARVEKDQTVTVGITDHAQHACGEVVFVELPAVGTMVNIGKECAVVESTKAAADVYAPASGEVIEINSLVVGTPKLVNDEPQSGGWLFKIRPSNMKDLDSLMDAKAYEAFLVESTH